jgi:hypothetical protein
LRQSTHLHAAVHKIPAARGPPRVAREGCCGGRDGGQRARGRK